MGSMSAESTVATSDQLRCSPESRKSNPTRKETVCGMVESYFTAGGSV